VSVPANNSIVLVCYKNFRHYRWRCD